jgi:DinB superfamily
MPETIQQYVTRINSYIGSTDPLPVLAETPVRLRALLSKLPDPQVRTRPAPDRWSLLEIAAHLSDVEIVIGYRVRTIVGAPDGVTIEAYDQDAWQQALRYNDRELAPTIDALIAARDNNLRLYRSFTDAQWNKYGIHSERGRESARDVVRLQAGHDLNHLRQIEAILKNEVAAAV